jgi:hypothetical protein
MQISDFIAFLALIISIYAIWIQNEGVRKQIVAQNEGIQKQLIVANINEYTKRYQEIIEKLPKSLIDKNFKLDSLTEDEQEKILRPMWLYFDLCCEEYILYHELSLIDEKIWRLWESAMISAFSRPAFYQCWQFILKESLYPPNFSNFVNSIMLNKHNTGRKV